jgi:mutator protein MutT
VSAGAGVIEVAAGLVFRDRKLLIAQRLPDAHLPNLWEFPGGKLELGETFQQCLERELMEETGIEAEAGELVQSLVHHYPERSILIKFFHCRWKRHEPRPILCQAVAWVTGDELARYPFPEADAQLLEIIRARWAEMAAGL